MTVIGKNAFIRKPGSISFFRKTAPPVAVVRGPLHRINYHVLIRSAVALSLVALSPSPSLAQQSAANWVATWAASPCAPWPGNAYIKPVSLHAQTVREIVHVSLGGTAVRIRVSNTFGTVPLSIAAAHIALRGKDSSIQSGTDRTLTFSGMQSIRIPAGGYFLSDPVILTIPALSDVAVSLYLPDKVENTAIHYLALQTSYVADGNATAADELPVSGKISSWPFLSAVEVSAPNGAGAIVALGSSITDGFNSTAEANRRWTDELARRLQADPELRRLSVLNEGISGNRVLHDGWGSSGPAFGASAISRFDRDVLALAGVRYVVLFEGGNDISQPGSSSAPLQETVSADELIAGLAQLAERAHEHGILVLGGTLTPFEGMTSNFYSPEREDMRMRVNEWLRTSPLIDAVLDFDRIVRDPFHPARLLPAYDSGDHLHPNDLGYTAMGRSVPLTIFRRNARGEKPAKARHSTESK